MSVEVAILKLLALLSGTPDELWVMVRISQHSTQITAATKKKTRENDAELKKSAVLALGGVCCVKNI